MNVVLPEISKRGSEKMESVFLSWIGLNEDDILSQLRFNCPKNFFYIYIIQLFKKYSKAGRSL